MIQNLDRRWYTAKDIKNLLDITSGQLFYWGQTWGLIKPEMKGKGRAHKDRYSFTNLLDLALIKELIELGFEPSKIRYILKPYDRSDAPKEWQGSIWNFFKDGREDKKDGYPGYDKAGCLIFMGKEEDEYKIYTIGRNEEILSFFKGLIERRLAAPKSFLFIDLLKIIREVEEKTGDRL